MNSFERSVINDYFLEHGYQSQGYFQARVGLPITGKYTHAFAYADANTYANANADAHAFTYAYADAFTNSEAYAYARAGAYADAFTNANTDENAEEYS